MSFEKRLQTGKVGERMVDAFLRQHGWIPYFPVEGVAHPFDRLAASPDKRRICVVEVKTKFRREAFPDTGIDRRHFDDYQHIATAYKLPVFLVFVDAKVGTVYGNWWSVLLEQRDRYPLEQGGIVYFPLSAMHTLEVIPEAERQQLLTMRESKWKPNKDQADVQARKCIHKPEFIKDGRCWVCEHSKATA